MDQLPDNATPLAPESVTVARIVDLAAAAVFLAVAGVLFWLVHMPVLAILSAAIGLALALWGTIVPPLTYRYTRYWLDQHGLYVQRGIWRRKRILVPLNRIQHSDVAQGPLQRRYQLGTLIVHTAGTTNASVSLSGLLHSTAVTLRNRLADRTVNADDAV